MIDSSNVAVREHQFIIDTIAMIISDSWIHVYIFIFCQQLFNLYDYGMEYKSHPDRFVTILCCPNCGVKMNMYRMMGGHANYSTDTP